jgi:tetratricopeptide (TPR) repeat protein
MRNEPFVDQSVHRDPSLLIDVCGVDSRYEVALEAPLTAAARALSHGDALSALKWLGRRTDAPARAMRGAALSQLGEFASAKVQLRAALRALGPKEGLLRARCLAAEAEIALALGDLRWSAEPVARVVAELQAAGDARNAAYLQLVAARAALRLGRPADAERLLRHAKLAPAAPLERTFAELVRVELAAKRGDPDVLTSALASAGAAAERAAIPALVSEVARIRDHYEGPTAVITSRGKARTASFCEVCALGRSVDVVIDGGGREVRSSGECVPFARRPVLFEVLRVLAEAWPDAVPRDALIARAFGARRPNESHRIRLRVEIGRLRKIVRPRLGVVAEGPGYALSAPGEVVLVTPLEESPASRLLSLMHGGEAWSASSLALALDVSERTVQRSLGELQNAGKVGPTGNGRGRRWVRLFEIPTNLLLPPRRPAP